MKYILLAISIIISVFLEAQPKISFERETYDFGAIMWKQPITAKFEFTNTGNETLVIHNVESSCGCIVSSWTKKPVRPYHKGVIEAVFDAKMLGHFHKSVQVYSNAKSRPYDLSVTGVVSADVVDYSHNYPIQIGNIHLDTNHIEFADANKEDRPTFDLKVANGSSKDYVPVLMHLPSYIEAKAIPEKLAPKETGVIRLVFHSEKYPFLGINRVNVYLARYPGDKVGEDNQLDVISVLLPDFSKLTAAQRAMAPVVRLSATEIDFGGMDNKKTMKKHIVITNTGRSDLKMEDIQVTSPALNVSLKEQSLAPGKSTKMYISVNAKYLKSDAKRTQRVLMITNDPKHPKNEIMIKVKK